MGDERAGLGSEIEFETRFAVATLATWRVSHLLSSEDGPFDVVVRMRERAGSGSLGGLMDCFYCLSVWTAAPLSLIVTCDRRFRAPVWLAVSGAACMLERSAQRTPAGPLPEADPAPVAQPTRLPEMAL